MADLHRIKTGVIWSGIEKFTYAAGQLCINLIIARLILPEEYALLAMITIFIAVGQTFVESGFSTALIHKQDRSLVDMSTVFYFNIAISIFIYLIIYAISPLIAKFYNNPIFIPLTRVVALNLIINALSIIQRVVLNIKVDFKTQAIISFFAILVSGSISIWMASHGYGVWAMVAQTLICHGMICILLWLFVRWHPLLQFSLKSFKQTFSYGSRLLASRLINTICQNLYSLAIGKVYSPNQVAYFSNANQLSLYSSTYLNEIIQRSLFPMLCEVQDEKDKLLNMYYKTVGLSSFIIFPIMVGIIVLAKPFVLSILNIQWIKMIPYLQIISFAYLWYPLMCSNQLFNVLGRTDIYLKCEIIRKIAYIIIVFSTLFINVTVLCWGIVVYNILEIVIAIELLKPLINISYLDVIKSILPSMLFSLGMGIITFISIIFFHSYLAQLLIGAVIATISYLIISIMFKSQDLSDIIKILKQTK